MCGTLAEIENNINEHDKYEKLVKLVREKWKDGGVPLDVISKIDKVAGRLIPEKILKEYDAFAVR